MTKHNNNKNDNDNFSSLLDIGDESSNAAVASETPPTPVVNSSSVGDTTKQPLPLGWTQIRRRKRPKKDNDNNNNGNSGDDWCCDIPSCSQRKRILPEYKQYNHSSDTDEIELQHQHNNIVLGTAIFCLHDTNPPWCQGYLFVDNDCDTRPWGLLAVQQELDDCLHCVDGGYRQVTLTAFVPSTTTINNTIIQNSKKTTYKWTNVEWTGGDMMRLSLETPLNNNNQQQQVTMQSQKMWTEQKAIPLVKKYFSKLIADIRIRKGVSNNDDTTPILELLPNVAIVSGKMMLRIPQPANNNNGSIEKMKQTK